MESELQRVLELQPSWSSTNTGEMDERGKLVRYGVTNWLRGHEVALSAAIGIPISDFFVEGRDGTGRKTRVPWARFGSRDRSPSATDGFYIVYLWAFDGSAVYLSLNQGTTDFENGEFVRKPLNVLTGRVEWARNVVTEWTSARSDLAPLALVDVGEDSLGRGYELGAIASIRYAVNAIPKDDQLLADAVTFAQALGRLYEANAKAPIPYEIPELIDLEDATDDAAGKKHRERGAGFRQNSEERGLIEAHAVKMAEAYYRANGWIVKTVGAPYDLELTRGAEKWTVEIKGTTSRGEALVLTEGEVKHHAKAHPNNALVVVRGIVLDRSTSPPTVSGGVLFERQPWAIRDDALRVMSYQYTVPDDFYGDAGHG